MIAVQSNKGEIDTFFINKDATGVTINGAYLDVDGNEPNRLRIREDMEGAEKWFVVANEFESLQIGDLSAQMMLQGRSGMSTCRCIKCNLSKSQWITRVTSRLLTHAYLDSGLNALIGLTDLPYWDMCPTNSIVLPLHCELGTVKYQLWDHLMAYLLYINCRTEKEDGLRLSIETMSKDIITKITDLGIAGTMHAVWWEEKRLLLSQYRKKRGQVAQKLKTALSSCQRNTAKQIRTYGAKLKEWTDLVKQIHPASESLYRQLKNSELGFL